MNFEKILVNSKTIYGRKIIFMDKRKISSGELAKVIAECIHKHITANLFENNIKEHHKWTFDEIKKEAQGCKSITDLRRKNSAAEAAARRNGVKI